MEIKDGFPLDEQSPEFQDWFNLKIQPKITFGDGKETEQTCSEFDLYGRPLFWDFENIRVKAVYFTDFSNKLDFKNFIIYGNL